MEYYFDLMGLFNFQFIDIQQLLLYFKNCISKMYEKVISLLLLKCLTSLIENLLIKVINGIKSDKIFYTYLILIERKMCI